VQHFSLRLLGGFVLLIRLVLLLLLRLRLRLRLRLLLLWRLVAPAGDRRPLRGYSSGHQVGRGEALLLPHECRLKLVDLLGLIEG
jgi:hypothetical protein